MVGYGCGRTPWMDTTVYPVSERLIWCADVGQDTAFLVDIGGNRGYVLEKFCEYFPKTPGRLYLQDLELVISGIDTLHPSITRACYDFFTEQPIKGTRSHSHPLHGRSVVAGANSCTHRRSCILYALLLA